jgi:hypothetical protein
MERRWVKASTTGLTVLSTVDNSKMTSLMGSVHTAGKIIDNTKVSG